MAKRNAAFGQAIEPFTIMGCLLCVSINDQMKVLGKDIPPINQYANSSACMNYHDELYNLTYSKQLTNGIPRNGKFYYRDVIENHHSFLPH